ncbi:MAG: hypothetical protein PWQ37_2786 [Candidatus Petromonas sp.]|jgi:hypothetical protein|nr:hypothetical protein [Candidatus Petromonas sp.]
MDFDMKTIVEEILSVLTKHELKACEALEILDLAKEDINYSLGQLIIAPNKVIVPEEN